MKLIGVGDNVVDYYKDQGKIYPGGNALNVAVFCNRLNHNQSSYMGIVGDDESAEHVVNTLQQEKIDIRRIRRAVGENGMAVVTLDEQGDRIFVGSNKGGIQSRLKLMLNELDFTYIRQHDLLHTSVFSHLEAELPLLCKIIDISFDFSTRYDEEYLQQVCPHISYAFFSGSSLLEEECMDLIKRVHLLGTSVVCVTRGEEGALLSVENQLFKQPIISTNVVDTLGAGDSFIAGFLSSYLPEKDIAKALHNGALVASQTCQDYGAFGYGKKHQTDCAMVLK
ncbi:PfkB family carbohydrate kinase [Priestia aryabhattai]|uniref:PfkB family carbohydrate kinase n=1 Tax=Priestia aryabhattai TaxID=412384 RepID=UPI00203AA68F|nr:PfkB family carbohydrate kinase [Priestia aryabhattai]MCM3771256.1 PfkB family carbohydrate kinase [Priestia aryabhattai]